MGNAKTPYSFVKKVSSEMVKWVYLFARGKISFARRKRKINCCIEYGARSKCAVPFAVEKKGGIAQ